MKPFRVFFFATLLLVALVSPGLGEDLVRAAIAAKLKEATKRNAGAIPGTDGWLFLTSELRFLSLETFWGEGAATVSKAPKADLADPIPAIVDFQKQLKAKGIGLLLVPVPPKASTYPWQLVEGLTQVSGKAEMLHAPLQRFYEQLRAQGVDVLDVSESFAEAILAHNRQYYCHTDTHWSVEGCAHAAQLIAQRVASQYGVPMKNDLFKEEFRDTEIEGDLGALLPAGTSKPPKEKLGLRQVKNLATGAFVEPDPNSPVLLMGDSHTLVFHDFAAEHSGLLDLLAFELGTVPDLIGTRGSGSTAVRISLYRKTLKDPEYLAKKKVVVWCFTAREFSESDQGWAKVPISK